jgi:hypothetical protein
MAETGLDALVMLGADQKHGSLLATSQGAALEKHYQRVIADERTARAHLGFEPLPPSASTIENLSAGMEQIKGQMGSLKVQLRPKESPLFSVAADKYIARLREAYGPNYVEIRYLEHRRDVWLALIKDKPVQAYTEDDLQTFVDEIQHLTKNYVRQKDYDTAKIKDYIAANKVAKDVGLGPASWPR